MSRDKEARESRISRLEATCAQKTASGNVYRSAADGRRVATRMKRKYAKKIGCYVCCVCGLWHVGGWR